MLPYFAGFTKKITRIFKAFNIKVCTKPIKTIKNILPTMKDFIDFNQQTGTIYQISCKNCSGIYIGETGHSFKTRWFEHKQDLNLRNLAKIDDNNINKKTTLVKHVVNFQYKGPFPLQAWKRAFFVCFIDFFCAHFNFNRLLQLKINKRNKECSFPHS